ncbi:MAG: SAVED domain-containing protein [Persephonella sp.]|nr:SAVED domain-containing protein [Persephonella sp.]
MSWIKHLKETGNRDTLIGYIKSRQVKKEELEELYHLLNSNDEELIYTVYRFLDENPEYIDYPLLSKTAGIEEKVLKTIFQTKPTRVFFPVVDTEKYKIASAHLFKLPFKVEKSSFSDRPELKKIKKYLYDKNLPTEDFFVIFDSNFKGSSYMLSVVAGLVLPEEYLSRYAFTGEVNCEGEIISVDYLKKKRTASEKKHLILITPKTFGTVREMVRYIKREEVNLPFAVLNKPDTEIKKSLLKIEAEIKEKDSLYSLKKQLSILNMKEEDLYINVENIPPVREKWEEKLNAIKQNLHRIYSSGHTQKVNLHIATSITSLSFATGVLLGAKRSYVLYHFQNDRYFPVIDLSSPETVRNIKQVNRDILRNSKNINIETSIKDSREVNLILYLASHNPVADVLHFTKNKNYVYITDRNFQGKIPIKPRLWEEYVSEIYSAVNQLREKYLIKRFSLFISCPSVMAMALGMAVGNFIDIYIYNYYPQTKDKYFKVFETAQLETIL